MKSEALLMNTSARQGVQPADAAAAVLKDSSKCDMAQSGRKIRVRVGSGTHAWDEDLMSMLSNHAGLEMLGGEANEIFRVERIAEDFPDVLLLTSCGDLDSDIAKIRTVRLAAPGVRIVMSGGAGAEREFLQYVHAGIRGYLPLGASVKDVSDVFEAVHAGKRPVLARCVDCCSIILSVKQLVCLPERCVSSWV
jgi:DNA-binding NarL/FixJ family response regulator